MMSKILVVDDEANIAELVKLYLEKEGFKVEIVLNGTDAMARLGPFNPDLVVLDLMLPDIDGFEVCKRIRRTSSVPVIMLTARREDVDKIVGLELGADDYLTKPFNPRELVARIRAIFRRSRGDDTNDVVLLEIGSLQVDLARQEARIDGRLVSLRTKEFTLLSTFMQNKGIVLSREKLLETVWGFDYYGDTRTVDVHVNHLRDKLAGSGAVIETLRGTGYKMTGEETPT